MRIKTVEMYTLNIPFYCDRVSKHMHRALTHSERVYVYRTELDNGIIGYGIGVRLFISGFGVISLDIGFNPYGSWFIHPSD